MHARAHVTGRDQLARWAIAINPRTRARAHWQFHVHLRLLLVHVELGVLRLARRCGVALWLYPPS